MLDNLRDFAKTWPGKILGVFVLIGLAGFGMSGVFSSVSFNNIAYVGKEEITTKEFERSFSATINEFAAQTGQMPTFQEAVSFGLVSNVINQLATQAAIDGLSNKFGLGVSDKRLAQIVRQDPSFATTIGAFDANNFRLVLQQAGWTEKEYFDAQTKLAKRQQLTLGLFDGIKIADAASKLMTKYGDEKRNIEYFLLDKDNLLPPSDPTDEEIAKYLSENQEQFRTKALREVKLFFLTPQNIADSLEIKEEEVKAEYERTKSSYVRIESRTISQAILDSELYEKRFQLGLENGENFEDLVKETGVEIIELGTLTQSQILDPRLAKAAFEIEKEGEFTIIDGFDGKRAIYVSKINKGGQIAFEEVKEQIANNLKLKQARQLYIDYLDQIEELRAAFKPIEQIAEQFKLKLFDISISQSGEELSKIEQIPNESYQKIASAIFNAKQGNLAPSIALGANFTIWFDIINIIPERDKKLSEVKEEIKQILLEEKINNQLKEKVDELVKAIKNGEDFANIAIANQYNLLQQNNLSRLNANEQTIFNQQVLSEIFSGPKGLVGAAQIKDGQYIIFRVLEVIEPDEINIAAKEFIDDSLSQSIFNHFVSGILQKEGLRINQQTLNRFLEPNSGNR